MMLLNGRDLFGVAFMLFCGFVFAGVAQVVSDAWTLPSYDTAAVLPDLLFDTLPRIETHAVFNDKAEILFLALAIPALLYERKLHLAARQTYLIQGLLWIFRAPAFLVTQRSFSIHILGVFNSYFADFRFHEIHRIFNGARNNAFNFIKSFFS